MTGRLYRARPSRRRRGHYAIRPLVLRFLLALALPPAAALATLEVTGELLRALAVGALAWLAAGIMLSRAIEARLHWNDQFASLDSAARAKLTFLLSWPIATPRLIWRMLVIKHL